MRLVQHGTVSNLADTETAVWLKISTRRRVSRDVLYSEFWSKTWMMKMFPYKVPLATDRQSGFNYLPNPPKPWWWRSRFYNKTHYGWRGTFPSIRFWGFVNSCVVQEEPLRSCKVTLWCGVYVRKVICHYFSEDGVENCVTVTAERYKSWAPAHSTASISECLISRFVPQNRLIWLFQASFFGLSWSHESIRTSHNLAGPKREHLTKSGEFTTKSFNKSYGKCYEGGTNVHQLRRRDGHLTNIILGI